MKTVIRPHGSASQQGVALIIALVLLVAITLLGLSGMQHTSLQERMSGNMYDRSLAMQSAEAALLAAQNAITANADIGLECTRASGNDCESPPANTYSLEDASEGWTNSTLNPNPSIAAGSGQYHIEILGDAAGDDDFGQCNSANNMQHEDCLDPNVRYYRVTARSHDPSTAGAEERSLVVLQAWFRRGI